jgi:hypothetical protein
VLQLRLQLPLQLCPPQRMAPPKRRLSLLLPYQSLWLSLLPSHQETSLDPRAADCGLLLPNTRRSPLLLLLLLQRLRQLLQLKRQMQQLGGLCALTLSRLLHNHSLRRRMRLHLRAWTKVTMLHVGGRSGQVVLLQQPPCCFPLLPVPLQAARLLLLRNDTTDPRLRWLNLIPHAMLVRSTPILTSRNHRRTIFGAPITASDTVCCSQALTTLILARYC